jgi:hypothetical protein
MELCQLLLEPSRQGHVFELCQTIIFLGEASREEVRRSRGPDEFCCIRWGDGWRASRGGATEAALVLFAPKMKRKQERREPDQLRIGCRLQAG